ncbi:MAG: hypothetical protein DMF89_06140 [Acidobacteria bacterium]|nr:MAG: hypothetical protein DMF89_06140 [Acidobacteriota bacterium]
MCRSRGALGQGITHRHLRERPAAYCGSGGGAARSAAREAKRRGAAGVRRGYRRAGLQAKLRLRAHVSVGNPAEAILRTAVARRSDLVVVGSHGLTGADKNV